VQAREIISTLGPRSLRPSHARPSAFYALGACALAVVYFVFPDKHLLVWTPLGVSSVVATLMGIRLNRPTNRVPWYLFAAALACFVTGDTVYNVLTDVLHQDNPFPSAADLFYLAMYPLIGAGLLALIRARTVSRDPAALIDAATIATGLGLLSWVYLILPYFQEPGLTWMQRATSVAYPLGDVLVLAMLARLLAGGARLRALHLLALGGGGLLVADVLYGWIQLNSEWQVGGPVDGGWVLYYVAWGAAALHPSMRKVGEALPTAARPVRLAQIALLAVVSLIAPGVLLSESITHEGGHSGTVGAFSAALYLLVITRLFGIVTVHKQSLVRERALRICWESLVTASDPEQIYAATLTAVRALTAPSSQTQTAILSFDSSGGVRLVAGSVDEDSLELRRWTLDQGDSGVSEAGRVSISPLHHDPEQSGILFVRAERPLNPEIHEALNTLASQVSWALESIRLVADIRQRQGDAQFKQLIQNASDIIIVVDTDGVIQYASPSVERRLGWNADQLAGAQFDTLLHPEDKASVRRSISDAIAHGSGQLVRDWRVGHFEGDHGSFEVVFNNLLHDPLIAGVVLTMRDVSERRELEKQLAHQAFHDALTGLANRSLFHDRLEHALSRAGRLGGRLAMVMLDLDEFKVVNDTLGHSAGDSFLIEVAQRLTAAVRPGETVARFGGDEFAILMEDVTDPTEVHATAERILNRLAQPFTVGGEVVRAGASAGLVITDGRWEPISLQDLLRQADLALYAAKDRGRGVAVLYHEDLSLRMRERVTRRFDLRRAIDNGEFTLLYQPIVAIETGEMVGAEALVRWMHPEKGELGPDEFITLAEETGLIIEIGGWVLAEACRQASVLSREGLSLRMSVNISAPQLERPAFIDEVAAAITDHGLGPGCLVLELTESVLIRDELDIPSRLHHLHSLGARIAIDDFGVGYSSLGYLQRFPIDILKIDKSFVDNLGRDNAQGGALARAVVSLSHALQLEVVAEGIERIEQRDELWSLGCGLGQGYLYARPLPPADLERLLISGAPLGPLGIRTGGSQLSPIVPPRPRQVSTESSLPR
jgi:diguanylate cyclase (GGDEF)-like protein/PAS domain S-box-containing protein